MGVINEILAVVILIIQIQSGQPVGTATGFFYVKNDIVYMVTNRHVILDEEKGIKPDTLRVKLHVDPTHMTNNVDLIFLFTPLV
jgi:S1-C subfamily serine protease